MTILIGFFVTLVGLVLFLVVKGKKLAMKYAWVVAPYLTNDPKNPNKWYCFTAVEQGEVKVIVRGKQVVGYAMNMPEKSLRRNKKNPKLTVNNAAFADVVEEPADTEEDDLLYWSDPELLEWRRQTYKKVKLVFVGIPPWQKLLHRPFRSAHQIEDPVTHKKTIEYRDGITDHARVREFARPFIARSIETVEGLKVTVGIEITFETTNVFEQLYNVDQFELRLDNIVPARIQELVKRSKIEDVLTAKEDTARALEDFLIGKPGPDGKHEGGILKTALTGYGTQAVKASTFMLEPEMSDEDKEAFTSEWREKQLAKGKEEKGKGDAKYLTSTSAPLMDNPALAEIERIRVAVAGKGTSLVIDRGSGSTTTDLAQLTELQRIRGSKGGDSK